jgi:hypothetical protein
VCPLLQGQQAQVSVVNTGRAAATLRVAQWAAGATDTAPATAVTTRRGGLAGGASTTVNLGPAKQPGYVQVEAFGAPVAVGVGSGPACAPGPGDHWWLPGGFDSGQVPTIVIANPDKEDASVQVVPHLQGGAIHSAPVYVIRGGSAEQVSLKTTVAAGAAVWNEVIATSGRVVVGEFIPAAAPPPPARAGQTGQAAGTVQPTATAAAPATPAAPLALRSAQAGSSPAWSFAGGMAGSGQRTELLLANPNAAPLTVQVQIELDRGFFTPSLPELDGPIAPGVGLSVPVKVSVPGAGAFALRVRSTGASQGLPFVAALLVEQPGASPPTYVVQGGDEQQRTWVLPSLPPRPQLVLANAGHGRLTATLGSAGTAGGGTALALPPGKVVVKPLPGSGGMQVAASGPGLLLALAGGGQVVPGAWLGGVPAGGPVGPGQAAAP